MKPKMILKTGVDIAMTITLLLLMAYQLVGEEAHERIGIAMAGKAFPKVPAGGRIALRILSVLIMGYGVIAFVKRDIWNYLILKNHFAFYDFSEPVIFFLLDYLAVMGLFVIVGYQVSKRKNILRSSLSK